MLCQKCNQQSAKIHITKVVNDQRMDLHLCEKCAGENNQIGYDYPFTINNFLSSFLDIPIEYSVKGADLQGQKYQCSSCGLTFDEFKANGKLGCTECYSVFSDKLMPILKRLHGNAYHSGKLPQRTGSAIKVKKEMEKLRTQLNKVIKEEEYEKAAEIRDKIKSLEISMDEDKG